MGIAEELAQQAAFTWFARVFVPGHGARTVHVNQHMTMESGAEWCDSPPPAGTGCQGLASARASSPGRASGGYAEQSCDRASAAAERTSSFMLTTELGNRSEHDSSVV